MVGKIGRKAKHVIAAPASSVVLARICHPQLRKAIVPVPNQRRAFNPRLPGQCLSFELVVQQHQ